MKNNMIFGKSLLDYLYLCPILVDPLLWAEKVSKTISKAVGKCLTEICLRQEDPEHH